MVEYRWDVETVSGGVVKHQYCATHRDALRHVEAAVTGRYEIVLVRDNDFYRSWAYVVDGRLSEWFEDAEGSQCTKVPVRFIREVQRGAA